MNKLIQSFEQNSMPNNILLDTYGISDTESFDCIFVAPSWTPEKIFDSIQAEQIFSGRFANTFKIKNKEKNYLFITLQIGAPNIIDFCLSCYKTKCEKFIFIGSVGGLVPEIKIGDIIVPEYAISGNGATLYLHEKVDSKNIFEHIYSSNELNNEIIHIANTQNLNILNVPVISIDSVIK